MKKLIFSIAVVFLSLNSAVSQTGWQVLNSGVSVNLYGVSFINFNTGFVCGANGTILKTINAGLNWVQLNSSVTYQLNDICFSDNNTWFCCGASGVIKSTNAGQNWVSVFNPGTFKICYVDNILYTITQNNLYKSSNAGLNWISILTETGFLRGLFFNNSNTGYAMGGNTGVQRKTTNGGLLWLTGGAWFPGEYTFGECHFFNSDTGCVCYSYYSGPPNYTYSYGIYKASYWGSGGSSWLNVYYSTNMGVGALTFSGRDTGYAVGGGGSGSAYQSLIIKSINGGSNWSPQSFSVNQVLTDVTFLNSKYGYAVGRAGTIIKTETGGISNVTGSSNETPSGYSLSQNYPNPFNSTSIIKFAVVKQGWVRIVVYDVMGGEVQTLVDEILNAGNYETAFDGLNLPSGVYFYSLEANGFRETKKMSLIK